MTVNLRAVAVLDAFTQAGYQYPKAYRRAALMLVLDMPPAAVFNADGDLVGVAAVVRLLRRGREVPIDGHRRIINPPLKIPFGGVASLPKGFPLATRVRQSREDPARAFINTLWDSVMETPAAENWRKPHGTVTNVYSTTADGYIQSTNASYATARSGGTFAVQTGLGITVGQLNVSSVFYCIEGFLSFDTSVIGGGQTVTAAVLNLWFDVDETDTDFTISARTKTWLTSGLTSADWTAGASLTGLTELATLATSGMGSIGSYKAFTSLAALLTAIGSGNVVEMCLTSSRHSGNNQPGASTFEYAQFSAADEGGTTEDPKLVITHTPASEPTITGVSPDKFTT